MISTSQVVFVVFLVPLGFEFDTTWRDPEVKTSSFMGKCIKALS